MMTKITRKYTVNTLHNKMYIPKEPFIQITNSFVSERQVKKY